jgi:hypothetical protein
MQLSSSEQTAPAVPQSAPRKAVAAKISDGVRLWTEFLASAGGYIGAMDNEMRFVNKLTRAPAEKHSAERQKRALHRAVE